MEHVAFQHAFTAAMAALGTERSDTGRCNRKEYGKQNNKDENNQITHPFFSTPE